MPLIAKELHDRPNGYSWSIKRTRAGYEGRKWFYVETDEEREAILAEALPKIGDAWDNSEELRFCVCTEVGPTERMGSLTYVSATFASLSSVGGGGDDPPRADGHLDAWTAIKPSIETQPVAFPVDEDDVPQTLEAPILNGEGTTRPAVITDYEVSVAYDLRQGEPDLDRFESLGDPCHTNRGAVTFPPVLKTSVRRTKGPGECLYRGYEFTQDGELFVVRHTISVRSRGPYSWYFRFENLDEEGNYIAPGEVRVLPSADWNGLFE